MRLKCQNKYGVHQPLSSEQWGYRISTRASYNERIVNPLSGENLPRVFYRLGRNSTIVFGCWNCHLRIYRLIAGSEAEGFLLPSVIPLLHYPFVQFDCFLKQIAES